jgi:hypothetical protein
MIKIQIRKSVSSLPLSVIERTRKSLTKFITELLDPCNNVVVPCLPALKINSRKGMSIPTETMEKTMERIVKRK